MNSYFPVFYNITEWNVCFIGGGKVAERRIETLCRYPCHIYIISGNVTGKIKEKAVQGRVAWIQDKIKEKGGGKQLKYILKQIQKKYKKNFQTNRDFSMIFACTDNRKVNREIYEYCRKKKIPVNIADCKEECDFYFPGILWKEEIVIGAAGNGTDHAKVKNIMDQLREVFYGEKGR